MDALTIAAASGIRSRMQSLDLLANNLANSGTAGFKRDQEFYGVFSSADASADDNGSVSTLPVIERQWTDFSAGDLQVTGNPMNVAISGSGFFVVNGPNGPLYTRNGNLKLLPFRRAGHGAMGMRCRIPAEQPSGFLAAKPIEISGERRREAGRQPIGQIAVVNFKSTDSLVKMGSACFQNTDPKNVPAAGGERGSTAGQDRGLERAGRGGRHAAGGRDAAVRNAAKSHRNQQRHGHEEYSGSGAGGLVDASIPGSPPA